MMDTGGRRKLQDELMSECRSFGSNYIPCSQSRKMSIGIVIDSSQKSRTQKPKENDVSAPVQEKINPMEGNRVNTPISDKQVKPPENKNSPWVSTKSFNPTSEVISKSNLPPRNGKKAQSPTYSVQFFANRTSDLEANEQKEKKFTKVSSKREENKDVTVQEKEITEDKTNKSDNGETNNLRSKLWEILETVSSPKKNVQAKSLNLNEKDDSKGNNSNNNNNNNNPVVNSDTIESDSEKVNENVRRRPTTRSLTRKKAPAKPKKEPIKKSTRIEKDQIEKDVFSFKTGGSQRLSDAFNEGPLPSKRVKIARKSFGVEVHESFLDKINKAKDKGNTSVSTEKLNEAKVSSKGNTGSTTEKLSSKENEFEVCKKNSMFFNRGNKGVSKTESLLVSKGTTGSSTEKGSSKVCKKNSVSFNRGNNTRLFMENSSSIGNEVEICKKDDVFVKTKKNFVWNTPENIVITPNVHETPCLNDDFEINPPVKSSPKRKLRDLDDKSSGEKIYTRKSDYLRSNAQVKQSVEAVDLETSPYLDTENKNSESSSEEQDSDNSEDSLNLKGYEEKQTLSPVKKIFQKKNIKTTKLSSVSPTPIENEETEELLEHLEQNQEDGMTSAVALFALALERVKGKMKSLTQKKSTEILMSVDKGIHLQLSNVETQIQEDVGKLVDSGRVKRKRLETKFQGLQEQLNGVYESFQKEVNLHVQDCKKTIEGLEAYKIELKGSMEKQRALHKKLLIQAEEAIESQLGEAEKRIATINDVARGKMIQLKNALAECLKDGILN